MHSYILAARFAANASFSLARTTLSDSQKVNRITSDHFSRTAAETGKRVIINVKKEIMYDVPVSEENM
jgi:hypothetical protein